MEIPMRTLYCLIPILLFTLLSCGSEPVPGEPGAVITVQDRSVLADEVADNFELHRGDTTSVNVLRDNILARELFLAHARELGYEADREVQRLVHERRREILQSAWLSYELDRETLPQGTVMDFWNGLGTGVRYTGLSLSDSLLMDSIADLVVGGEDLSLLAEEFGMDNITRTTRGNIQITDVLYANLLDLDYLADPVPGDVIGPYPVPIGYRILRVDSVWTYEPESFQADSQRIESMLLSRQREIRKQFVEDSLKVASNVTVNMEIMELIAERGDGYTFVPFTDEELDMTAVSWDGGTRDVFSVTRNISNLPGYLPRQTDNPQWLAEYAERLAMFDIEMELALQAGLDTVASTARQLEVKELETLLDHYYENRIAPSLQPDSALLNEVYLEIRENNPVHESRVYLVLFLSSIDKVAAARGIMESGGDMIDNSDNFEIFPPILADGEEFTTVPITRAMVPEADRDILFGMETGEETLVALNDTTSLWFRLVSVNPEHIPEFSEIRDRVLNLAEQRLETEVIGGLVDSLEAVYHPYVDYGFFEEFYVPAETDTVSTEGETQEVTDAL